MKIITKLSSFQNLFLSKGFVAFFSFLMTLIFSSNSFGQVNITPIRSAVAGFPTWTDTSVAGTTYIQLLTATSSTVTPAMDFNAYTGETLNFTARTFGGTTAAEIILTVSISTDNGGSWLVLGTRTPASSTLTAQAPFDISAYNGTQVKLKFSVGGTNNAIGVGIASISITGTLIPVTTDWCNVQSPTTTQNILQGSSINVYAQAYKSGLTEAAGAGTGLSAWIGYSSTNDNPANAGWTWVPATFNVQAGNNDEFTASIGSGLAVGNYYFASRFQIGSSSYTYGGSGGVWNNDNVALNVNSNLVDFANIQFPTSGTITQGDTYNVYAQVYEPGTEAAGALAGITSWIGYSTSNTNPNTWTNWVPATFNAQVGNNDEYVANIASGLSPSNYFYASRFQKEGSTEYVYGGTNGSPWSTSGTLTVNAAVPVVTAAAPTGTVGAAFTYTIVATNTPTSYAISSGNLPTGLALNTATGAITGTPSAAGSFSVDVTATNGGGTSAPATLSFTIAKANQTITFGALTPVTYGAAPYTITATASSTLTVSFASSNTAVATVSGNTITVVGAGTTNITASQAGDSNYNSATDVIQVLTVNQKALTITGLTADNKLQDGTTNAVLSGTPSLNGVENADLGNVTVSGTPVANFASALPGTGISVTVTGYTLAGTAAGNYTVSQPTGLTADITALTAPTANLATGVLQNTFNANWNAVPNATSYAFDLSTNSNFITVGSSSLNEGFNAGTTVPSGWAFTSVTATYTTATNFGAATPSVRLDATGDRIETPILAGNATQLSFWMKGQGTDAITALLVEGFDGSAWTTIQNINPMPTVGTTYTFNAGSTPALPSNIVQFRFTYSKSAGNLAFDDVAIAHETYTPNFVSGYDNLNVGNVTTYPITGLTENTTYYYRVRAVSGTAQSNNSNTITVTTKPSVVVWNAGWSNTTGPDQDIEASIEGPFNSGTDGEFTAKKVTINIGGSLTIAADTNITVVNEVENTLTENDFVIQNNGNLIQINDVSNSGNISVTCTTTPLKRLDYVLWSAPVTGQQLQSFSLGTLSNRFYTYNPSTNFYEVVASPSTTNFNEGTGYLIRVPNNHPTTATPLSRTFTGVPNNGDLSISVTSGTWNAIGNPYPSTIDADEFITANNLTDPLYFWRKDNAAAGTAYATYTLAGGAGTASNVTGTTMIPDGTIAVGQGFLAKATSTTFSLTNAMRNGDTSAQFFRASTADRSRVWLNLFKNELFVNQTMVAYMPSATNAVDSAIDGRFFENNIATQLSSVINGEKYAVQGRAPFMASDIVSLGFKAEIEGNYSIGIDHLDGIFANGQEVFLKDNLTNTVHNLSNGNYNFASAAGNFDTRFEMVYQSTLATENPVLSENTVIVYKKNQDIVVNAGSIKMKNVQIYDIQGRLLVEQKDINTTITKLEVGTANQVLIVKVTSNDNVVVTKKLINY